MKTRHGKASPVGTIAALGLVLIAAATFHSLSIRDGHNWNGDFSLYVAHAKNIAESLETE